MMTLRIGNQGQKQSQNRFSQRKSPGKKKGLSLAGFTLIEILLVVVIVAIIISIATPQFRKSLTTIQLANTTQDIAQLMRFLRAKAITEKSAYQLKFDLGSRKYSAQNISGGKTSIYDKLRFIPDNINIAATVNPVNFYPDGTIDKVTIYLFKGKSDFFKDMEKAINKEFELGQVQSIAHTEYIYTITTQPSIGRVEVIVPE